VYLIAPVCRDWSSALRVRFDARGLACIFQNISTDLFRNWRVQRVWHYIAIEYRYGFRERHHSVWNAAIVPFLRWVSAP